MYPRWECYHEIATLVVFECFGEYCSVAEENRMFEGKWVQCTADYQC